MFCSGHLPVMDFSACGVGVNFPRCCCQGVEGEDAVMVAGPAKVRHASWHQLPVCCQDMQWHTERQRRRGKARQGRMQPLASLSTPEPTTSLPLPGLGQLSSCLWLVIVFKAVCPLSYDRISGSESLRTMTCTSHGASPPSTHTDLPSWPQSQPPGLQGMCERGS